MKKRRPKGRKPEVWTQSDPRFLVSIYCKNRGLTVSLCFYGISNHKLGFGGNVRGIFTGNGHFQQIYGRGEHFPSEIVGFHPILNFYCHQLHILL